MNLSSVFTWPTFFLAIGINILMLFLRRVVQLMMPTLSPETPRTLAQNVWERVVLPTLPAVLGAVFCLLVPSSEGNAVGFAYPAVVVGTWSRVLYGVGTGWFSSYIYVVFKFLLKKEWGIDVTLPGDSLKPPANVPSDTLKTEEKKP